MGYTTDFHGRIKVTPPMSAAEVKYINAFNDSRRMDREAGPYFVGGSDGEGIFNDRGQGHDSDVRNYNSPDASQPSLWCGRCASDEGEYIEWDGGEKFYESAEWMQYIIDHFLGANPIAKTANSKWLAEHLQGHTCNGVIEAQGEEPDDQWTLVVQNNKVSVVEAGGTLPATEEIKLIK